MNSEISASFTFRGLDFEPEEICKKVGITPSKTWKASDLIYPKATIRRKQNGWSVKLKLDEKSSLYLEDHIRSVIEQLEPGWLPLIEICKKYDAEINCVIYAVGDERPAVHFDKEIVDKAAKLNAEIDIDLYFIPDN